MAYSEWYQGYLRQEHEEALRRERGASRQHATFSQKSPAPPTVQEQLSALSVGIYAARRSMANREAFEARKAQEVLAKPPVLSGAAIYKVRAAQVSAHRLAASQGLPRQPAHQAAPTLPDADSIYRRRQREAKGLG